MRKKIEIWEYLWAERKDQLQQKSKDKCSYCLQPVPSTLSFTLLPEWVANLGMWDVSFQLKSFRHCPHPYRMRSKTGGTPDRGLIGDLALDTTGQSSGKHPRTWWHWDLSKLCPWKFGFSIPGTARNLHFYKAPQEIRWLTKLENHMSRTG